MNRILDFGSVTSIANAALELQDETGYTDEEFIPGLICAVLQIAGRHESVDQMLDEAANLLADGGVLDE